MSKLSFEPYRLFFATGSFLGLWGVLVWVLHYFQRAAYPVIQHPATMMGGFLLCFVCGFLMTAAPKFTASHPMTSAEAGVAILLNIFLLVSGVFFEGLVFYLGSAIVFLFLIIYFVRRFLRRSQNPPPSFVFIGLGLLMGFLGAVGMAFLGHISLPESFERLIRLFYLQGYVMSLFIGVGSRLIPALLGHEKSPYGLKEFSLLMALFGGSYLVEALVNSFAGALLKNLIVTAVLIFIWRIHQIPRVKSRLSAGLIIAAWCMLGGLWGSLWDAYRIHFLHLFFIGGLGLMTLMISVRVVLSHGHHGLWGESKFKSLVAMIIIFVIAAVTRVTAGFLPAAYMSHLVYAALVWCVGVVIWMVQFLPKIYRVKDGVKI